MDLPDYRYRNFLHGYENRNFDEFTMLEAANLAQYIGFTEEEVMELCEKYHKDFERVKKWYDGYILEEYQVEYIFVGKMEHEKYENLNDNMLKTLGKIVFQDENSETYILKVNKNA